MIKNKYIRRILKWLLLGAFPMQIFALECPGQECLHFQKDVITSSVFWQIGAMSTAMVLLGYAVSRF